MTQNKILAALAISLVIATLVISVQHKITNLENINRDLNYQVSSLETNLEIEQLLRQHTEAVNELLVTKDGNDKVVEVEKKVYVDKVRDPKVSTAEQVNLLTDELESQWSNLSQ